MVGQVKKLILHIAISYLCINIRLIRVQQNISCTKSPLFESLKTSEKNHFQLGRYVYDLQKMNTSETETIVVLVARRF